jgi:hypothetical protein
VEPNEKLSADQVLDRLAESLHFSTERFDPFSATGKDWSVLQNVEKEFYRACVRELFCDKRAITAFLLASGTIPTAM